MRSQNFVNNVGMLAKYTRQASLRQSTSTPTVAKSQFSHQQSPQTTEKSDDKEV